MEIRPLRHDELAAGLALIADYQRFYGVAQPDEARNAAFFARFVAPSDAGELLGAFAGGALIGYACLYWTFSSVSATDVVLLNDLYVLPEQRGDRVGEALIAATVAVARDRGAARVRWWTAIDNRRAQRLYERTGAERSAWFEYEIDATG
ncbi:MAG: GNAT family N-acetyltransferase [Solirubrobacterales bacterium]|nr:GNAT family N-acetyltransferase [Solirubrobacterales bacterium]